LIEPALPVVLDSLLISIPPVEDIDKSPLVVAKEAADPDSVILSFAAMTASSPNCIEDAEEDRLRCSLEETETSPEERMEAEVPSIATFAAADNRTSLFTDASSTDEPETLTDSSLERVRSSPTSTDDFPAVTEATPPTDDTDTSPFVADTVVLDPAKEAVCPSSMRPSADLTLTSPTVEDMEAVDPLNER
jgi:hypothetical protein